jgi:hypothetical protein
MDFIVGTPGKIWPNNSGIYLARQVDTARSLCSVFVTKCKRLFVQRSAIVFLKHCEFLYLLFKCVLCVMIVTILHIV